MLTLSATSSGTFSTSRHIQFVVAVAEFFSVLKIITLLLFIAIAFSADSNIKWVTSTCSAGKPDLLKEPSHDQSSCRHLSSE
jgi:hypothetical protein